ncbi:hypothetical protein COCNU_scaffold026286G000030 [Cocos nucifera]|nr:hypothetical protein [Cocos nucifera]
MGYPTLAWDEFDLGNKTKTGKGPQRPSPDDATTATLFHALPFVNACLARSTLACQRRTRHRLGNDEQMANPTIRGLEIGSELVPVPHSEPRWSVTTHFPRNPF